MLKLSKKFLYFSLFFCQSFFCMQNIEFELVSRGDQKIRINSKYLEVCGGLLRDMLEECDEEGEIPEIPLPCIKFRELKIICELLKIAHNKKDSFWESDVVRRYRVIESMIRLIYEYLDSVNLEASDREAKRVKISKRIMDKKEEAFLKLVEAADYLNSPILIKSLAMYYFFEKQREPKELHVREFIGFPYDFKREVCKLCFYCHNEPLILNGLNYEIMNSDFALTPKEWDKLIHGFSSKSSDERQIFLQNWLKNKDNKVNYQKAVAIKKRTERQKLDFIRTKCLYDIIIPQNVDGNLEIDYGFITVEDLVRDGFLIELTKKERDSYNKTKEDFAFSVSGMNDAIRRFYKLLLFDNDPSFKDLEKYSKEIQNQIELLRPYFHFNGKFKPICEKFWRMDSDEDDVNRGFVLGEAIRVASRVIIYLQTKKAITQGKFAEYLENFSYNPCLCRALLENLFDDWANDYVTGCIMYGFEGDRPFGEYYSFDKYGEGLFKTFCRMLYYQKTGNFLDNVLSGDCLRKAEGAYRDLLPTHLSFQFLGLKDSYNKSAEVKFRDFISHIIYFFLAKDFSEYNNRDNAPIRLLFSENELMTFPKAMFDRMISFRIIELGLDKEEHANVLLSDDRFSSLRNLRKLTMSRLKLTEIPQFIKHFPKLQILRVKNNKISELPKWFKYFSGVLKGLDISRNEIEYLPEYLSTFKFLKTLILDEKVGRDIGSFEILKKLHQNGVKIEFVKEPQIMPDSRNNHHPAAPAYGLLPNHFLPDHHLLHPPQEPGGHNVNMGGNFQFPPPPPPRANAFPVDHEFLLMNDLQNRL